MNKQFKIIDGERIPAGIEWTDYTWNPIAGCLHDCRWTMPDGKVAVCYAETVASGLAQKAYPDGFEHHYCHAERLSAPLGLKTPSKIFAVSMGDLFGHWVPELHIKGVLRAIQKSPRHTFQLLTKNPVRAKRFVYSLNTWVGASSPPDYMWGNPSHGASRSACYGAAWKRWRTFRSRRGCRLSRFRGMLRPSWPGIPACWSGR